MSHTKRSQHIFVCNFVKSQRILIQFPVLDLAMNDTYNGENFINVATLPFESRNSENVILQGILPKKIA